jgi:hypothetical protein
MGILAMVSWSKLREKDNTSFVSCDPEEHVNSDVFVKMSASFPNIFPVKDTHGYSSLTQVRPSQKSYIAIHISTMHMHAQILGAC